MLLVIKEVLNINQIKVMQKLLASSEFIDGKLSAGEEAIRVKNNQEVKVGDDNLELLNNTLMASLLSNKQYQSCVYPHRVAIPFYARYQEGMEYGFHVDDPVMGPMGGRYRTDVSTTIFLNSPEDYDGGEITIQTTHGENSFKCEAGDAIVYPSDSWHRVAPVTSGERLVAVTWSQSMVRDAAQRKLLYDLSQARDVLLASDPASETTGKVSTAYVNLLRMWAEV